MFTPVESAVMRWIVLNDLDVTDQPRARISTLYQVVAQQGITREPAVKNPMQGLDLVDPFSNKDPLAVQILIHVRSGASVDVESRLSGIDAGKPGTRRTLNADSNPRLQDAVACDHDPFLRIDDRLI